jgi:hypothetical protein
MEVNPILLAIITITTISGIFIGSLYWFSRKQILSPSQKLSLARFPKVMEELEIVSSVKAVYDKEIDDILKIEVHHHLTKELDDNLMVGLKNLSIQVLERQEFLVKEQLDKATEPIKIQSFKIYLLGVKATLAEKKAIKANDERRKLK